MEIWVLHFIIMFANGQAFMVENTERFSSYTACMTEGQNKGSKIVEAVVMLSGTPAGGKYNCRVAGSEV